MSGRRHLILSLSLTSDLVTVEIRSSDSEGTSLAANLYFNDSERQL